MNDDKAARLRALINQAAADAEAVRDLPDDGAPLPPHVKVSRPNQRVYIDDDDIDLNTEVVIVDGERLTEERAEAIAAEVAMRVREAGLVRDDRDGGQNCPPLGEHPDRSFRVEWSDEDQEYVGMCAQFPSLSYLDADRDAALAGIKQLVHDIDTEEQSADQ